MRFIIFGFFVLFFAGLGACKGEPIDKQSDGKSASTSQEEDVEIPNDSRTHGVKVVLGKDIREKNVILNDYRIEAGDQQLFNRVIADMPFEKRMKRKIIATAYDPKGAEYTQMLIEVEIPAGTKKELEFAFDSRLELLPKYKVVLNIADTPEKDKKKVNPPQ